MDILAPYLDRIQDPEHRAEFGEVMAWVMATFPQLEPRIAWNQPMFTAHGTFIIGFSVASKHFSVSIELGGIEHFRDAIDRAGYSQTPMLFRVPFGTPVNYDLLRSMIEFNLADKAEITTFWRK